MSDGGKAAEGPPRGSPPPEELAGSPGRLLVGLTGGLAAGKSTVARLLAEAGCTVVDADRLVAELYRPGAAGAARVRELFGDGVLTAAGGVDHRRLGARVFADPEARRRLEQAIHPLVREAFRQLAAEAQGVVVLEATLLVEAGWADAFDVVISVEAPEPLRRARAVARGLSEEEAARRLAAQGDGERRRSRADHVLINDGDLDRLRERVAALVRDLRNLLSGEAAGAARGG